MGTVICEICGRWIRKSNIARHKKKHGTFQPCLRCSRKRASDTTIHKHSMAANRWFQTFQTDLLADIVFNTMKEKCDLSYMFCMSEDEFESWYVCAIYHLEYFWILADITFYNRVLQLIKINMSKLPITDILC
jgi:hypothetical protein